MSVETLFNWRPESACRRPALSQGVARAQWAMESHTGQTLPYPTTLGQLCAVLWVSQSWPVLTQPGILTPGCSDASVQQFSTFNPLSHGLIGLILCAIIVFNIFEWLPHLCTPHIQLSVRFLSWAGNFSYRFNHKDQGGFTMPRKEEHRLVD